MARTALTWSDREMRDIMQAIRDAHHRFPRENDRFLDTLIADIATVTGRLYGQSTYDRLIRSTLGVEQVTRRPSAPTIQKAIARAQASAVPEAAGTADATPDTTIGGDARPDHAALRSAVGPAVRSAMAPLQAALEKLAEAVRHPTLPSGAGPGRELDLELAQAQLQEAHARMRRLEQEHAQLRRELAIAEARAQSADTRVAVMLSDVLSAIGVSATGAKALADIAQRLEGTERFLKQQNDAVRLQATAEVDGLRRHNQQLRDQISHLQLESDQYRRALTAQRRAAKDAG